MSAVKTIDILGGGPAGLYCAILLRRRLPEVKVRVFEQNPRGATFGFGVVFSDQALEFLKADDPAAHALIAPQMEQWRNMTLSHPDGQITLDGVGFSAIGRLKLIDILCDRASQLGAELLFATTVKDVNALSGDLVIGADGLNSLVRRSDEAAFATSVEQFQNHFAWFGADIPFDTLTQTFVNTNFGPFNAHHYRFSPTRSTFIVECGRAAFKAAGFEGMSEADSAALCADIFKDTLQGTPLITNKSNWRVFPRLWCDRWVSGNRAILGDAAHTAHFSIGSGTRLALEDAIALIDSIATAPDLDTALETYDATRRPIAHKLVRAANTSATWYDSFGKHMTRAPLNFAHGYLMRSGRMTDDRARQIAPEFMADYDAAMMAQAAQTTDLVPDDSPGAIEVGYTRSDHANCSDILWQNLSRNPDKPALIGPAGTLTYAELVAEASRWGNAFLAAGLRAGDRIPFLLDDTPANLAAFFGAVRAGLVPVLLNTLTTVETLSWLLRDTDARLAICEGELLETMTEAASLSPVEKLVVVNGSATGDVQVTETAFLQGQPEQLDCAPTGPDDMAFWMYSSGTTGRPKGIVHLHHDMAYSNASFGKNCLLLRTDDICFSVPKIFFAYGFGNSITFPFSEGATTLLLPGRPEPNRVLDMIETYRPTVFYGLPTLYTALCKTKGAAERDLSSLRQSMSAAETLSEDIYAAWKDLAGHGPTEGLGSTELLHVYLSNRLDDHRPGAAGARVPGYEVKLIDPDGAETQDEGVMMVRGHSSAPCYWNNAEKSAETMRDGWIWTGDRFRQEEGYYYFLGRADDLVKVSGQWVWPLEVERCLAEHPDVHECAVLAHILPDKRTVLRAFVQLANGNSGDPDQTRALQDFAKSRLMPFKYPRLVDYLDALPKTGTGKIDRQALRNIEVA